MAILFPQCPSSPFTAEMPLCNYVSAAHIMHPLICDLFDV